MVVPAHGEEGGAVLQLSTGLVLSADLAFPGTQPQVRMVRDASAEPVHPASPPASELRAGQEGHLPGGRETLDDR